LPAYGSRSGARPGNRQHSGDQTQCPRPESAHPTA
jgi:hypothetical protein